MRYLNQFLDHLKIERGLSVNTIAAYKHDLSRLASFLSENGVDDIALVTKDDIRAFLAYLANKRGNSPVTRARKQSAVNTYFKFLKKERFIKENPAEDIEIPKLPEKEPAFLSEDESKHLIETVGRVGTPFYVKRDLAIISLLLTSGIRVSELVGLKLRDVDFRQGIIRVRRKGNKQQSIPINHEAVRNLKNYLAERPESNSQYLFLSRNRQGLKQNGIYHTVRKYLNEAEIAKEKVGPHTLRHTAFTMLLNKGVNLAVIQQLAGHKSLSTTERYLHVQFADIRDAVNRISLERG